MKFLFTINNKFKLLIFFILMLFLQNSYAQFSIGIEGGVNASKTDVRGYLEDVNEKPFTGFFLGVAPRYTFNKLTVLADINYSYRGHALGHSGVNAENSKFRYTNVIFSPQIEYRIHKSIGIDLGIYFGFEIDEAVKLLPPENWYSTKESNFRQTPDYGVNIGMKYFYKKLYIKVLFDLGIRNVLNSEVKGKNGEDVEYYNRSILFGIGYLLGSEKN